MSASIEGRFVGASQAETDAFDASSIMSVDPKATITNNTYTVEECFNDADDYDLAGLEYEEIVGTINEIENVENENVPVHKSKGNETIVNIPNCVTSQPSKHSILPYATGNVTINIYGNSWKKFLYQYLKLLSKLHFLSLKVWRLFNINFMFIQIVGICYISLQTVTSKKTMKNVDLNLLKFLLWILTTY